MWKKISKEPLETISCAKKTFSLLFSFKKGDDDGAAL